MLPLIDAHLQIQRCECTSITFNNADYWPTTQMVEITCMVQEPLGPLFTVNDLHMCSG